MGDRCKTSLIHDSCDNRVLWVTGVKLVLYMTAVTIGSYG